MVGIMRLKVLDSIVQLQPLPPEHAATGQHDTLSTLHIDLKMGSVTVSPQLPLPADTAVVLGVIGMLRVRSGCILAVITRAHKVAAFQQPVLIIDDVQLIAHEGMKAHNNDLRLAALLAEALDPHVYGAHLLFSHTTDITTSQFAVRPDTASGQVAGQTATGASQQRKVQSEASSLWQRADRRFLWNGCLGQVLVDRGAHEFVQPIMCGYAGQIQGLTFDGPTTAGAACDSSPSVDRSDATATASVSGVDSKWRGSISLMGRVSAQRSGAGLWRRGLDMQGACACFVETEQCVDLARSDGAGGTAQQLQASFVTVRSCVPLLYSQVPVLQRHGSLRLGVEAQQRVAWEKHATAMAQHYQAVVILNVVLSGGPEEPRLHAALSRLAAMSRTHSRVLALQAASCVTAAGPVCHAEVLSMLGDCLGGQATRSGVRKTVRGATTAVSQPGVVHITCLDGVDACDAVQHSLSEQSLEHFLRSEGLLVGGAGSLRSSLPELSSRLGQLWSRHADILAHHFTATPSLTSAVLRSRTAASPQRWVPLTACGTSCANAAQAARRWYKAHFQDARRQDAMDLLTATHATDTGPGVLTKSKTSYALLQLSALFMLWGLAQLGALMAGYNRRSGTLWAGVVSRSLPPLAAGLVLLLVAASATRRGSRLGFQVEQVQLCPQLVEPFTTAT